jgi:hypothetical protein
MILRVPFPVVPLFTLMIVSLGIFGLACGTSPETTGVGAEPAPWCAVETGIPGNRGVLGQLVLGTRPVPDLEVLRQQLGVTEPEYHDEFSDSVSDAGGAHAFASQLPDGTWLILLSGPGPWYEFTRTLLHFADSDGVTRLRSAHLEWSGDVPPVHAWAAIDGGWVHVDDRELKPSRQIRLDFRLQGVLLGSDGMPSAEPWRVWSSGHFVVRLQDGGLPPVPDELLTWFAQLVPPT